MAGHSKWANIKHKKAKEDSKRAKVFTKLIREIVVSAKLGGGDVDSNPRLRAAVTTALSSNMTRDTVNRAVKRGSGGGDEGNVDELVYEGYAPHGVAVIVECMTNNKNRTVGEVRHAFTKNNGNLGTDGSVSYMFKKIGIINLLEGDEDEILEASLNLGADDLVVYEDGTRDVVTTVEAFIKVKAGLDDLGFKTANAEITMDSDIKVTLNDVEKAQQVLTLIEMLEDLDDVQNVYSNVEITENLFSELN